MAPFALLCFFKQQNREPHQHFKIAKAQGNGNKFKLTQPFTRVIFRVLKMLKYLRK